MNRTRGNELFPIFLQLNQLHTLLVGGGNIALEKLGALIGNSPEAKVTIVAKEVSDDVRQFVAAHSAITLCQRAFSVTDLNGVDIVVVASNNPVLNNYIRDESRKRNILINVADKPALCDFYLGSVVKKGDLKLGISTNGKSPTIAKRIRELLSEALPEEIDETLTYMSRLREQLKGDFAAKVKALNAHTLSLLEEREQQ